MRVGTITAAILLVATLVVAAPSKNKISKVQGFSGTLSWNNYGGYISPQDGGKQLYYWFAESQNNPSKDPVVLWLNGGPGCSSFDGFVYEHGPFTFEEGGYGANQKLSANPYSWNKVANMIYLDSPAGVGFSYSTNPRDYDTNDQITAKDSHQFLLGFFKEYPEFKNNSFYIAGESYAGVYVPTLAKQVMDGNKNPNTFINMKGILVGNGVTDKTFDGNAHIPFIFGHGLIPYSLMDKIEKACHGDYWNATSNCRRQLTEANGLLRGLNIYDLYQPCYGETESTEVFMNDPEWRLAQRHRDSDKQLGGMVPCMDSRRAHDWLNLPQVRTEIHALPSSRIGEWTICTRRVHYQRTTPSTIPIHKALLAAGYKVLVYSGDVDMCVPYTGSEAWTASLGFRVQSDWRSWKLKNHQVAGYVIGYEGGLTFATIKGSGHTVPQYKPEAALHFFSSFLEGKPF